ncbi:11818_t:CDS:2, partial [Scutellospora calospora]
EETENEIEALNQLSEKRIAHDITENSSDISIETSGKDIIMNKDGSQDQMNVSSKNLIRNTDNAKIQSENNLEQTNTQRTEDENDTYDESNDVTIASSNVILQTKQAENSEEEDMLDESEGTIGD